MQEINIWEIESNSKIRNSIIDRIVYILEIDILN